MTPPTPPYGLTDYDGRLYLTSAAGKLVYALAGIQSDVPIIMWRNEVGVYATSNNVPEGLELDDEPVAAFVGAPGEFTLQGNVFIFDTFNDTFNVAPDDFTLL